MDACEPVAAAAGGSTVYALTSAGLFRSSAGGAWVNIGAGISSPHGASAIITAFAVDPSNPQLAYAGTSTGLFKTTSGDDAWSSYLPYSTYVRSEEHTSELQSP